MTESNGQPAAARKKLEAGAALNWLHWLIVSLSVLLTFFAWYYAKSELDLRIQVQFDREADQVVELVQERIQKYEDALWSGVALIRSLQGDIEHEHWKTYAENLNLEHKYPGINGIGVIHALSPAAVPEYLSRQRQQRPDFKIHPAHSGQEYFPISFVVPVAGNEKAIGLDIAHESNRFAAAKKARDTGEAQITGPITLVQDSGQTPGFLFYAPYYQGGAYDQVSGRRENFLGMVYAPFVVRKLMEGALEKEKRQVGLRLVDGKEVLYDEHVASEEDYDADPLFKRSIDLPLHGRMWTFDIWSAKSFREASLDSQPLTILLGGIFIDSLLIALFVSISRTSHRALGYADTMTAQLQAKTKQLKANEIHLANRAKQLETSNHELEQFAYVASHDLQEPLRKISSYGQLLREECGSRFTDEGHDYLDVVIHGANRLKTLVSDLLSFSRITSRGQELAPTSAASCLRTALEHLEIAIQESGAQVSYDPLPQVIADQGQLVHVFQNLIGNALKYRSDAAPQIHISGRDLGKQFEIFVEDNGIGIDPKFYDRIFEIFQRLHNRREYGGTGIGLAMCKRIVERFGGRIWLDSTPGKGSTFYFTIDNATLQGGQDVQIEELDPIGASH